MLWRWMWAAVLTAVVCGGAESAELRTWDGRHSLERIQLTLVYFVPRDRRPLPDWRDRVEYFRRRIQQFHAREFQGASILSASVLEEPFRSERDTAQLREGDADALFFKTLREVDERLSFARGECGGFPILLVLSDINWRPLDDFYRLKPGTNGPEFEGNWNAGEHFPGAVSGGARAAYLAKEGKGWGLVSADGWRVPYRGSDCVVYHEGCGHTVGLPHPEPENRSVMSLGQYHGWINESWLDREQKARLGWQPPEEEADLSGDLFTQFRALPEPHVPKPGEEVRVRFDWPAGAQVASCRVRMQTELFGPWVEQSLTWEGDAPETARLGAFDRPTPVSYRVEAALRDGQTVELWGYFQVRRHPEEAVIPDVPLAELSPHQQGPGGTDVLPDLTREVDLLALIDPQRDQVRGEWRLVGGKLESPRAYGARIEIPCTLPEEYELTAIVEPLDEPDGLILGQVLEGRRFLVLLNYTPEAESLSALENVDGLNVGRNATTRSGQLFRQGRLSHVRCAIRPGRVTVQVDGITVIDWRGDAARLSLSEYWSTPQADRLFLGAYDCRYRFHRVTLRPLTVVQEE